MNPFLIETLSPDSPFCNRREEIRRLASCAESGTNVVLFSPRRHGKTSLALRVQAMLEKEGYVTVYCQFFGVDSVMDVASRIARSVLGAIHEKESLLEKGKRYLKYFKTFRLVLKPSEDGFSIGVEPPPAERPMDLLERILDELAEFSAKSGLRINVVLDEFQEITRLKESARVEGIMRGKIQGLSASFFFLGSRRGILLAMFSDRKRPFFQSAIPMELPPLPQEDVVPFLFELFQKAGKSCSKVLCAEISSKVDRHPYYMQRIAREAFELSRDEVTSDDVNRAVENVTDMERYAFEAVLSNLSVSQVRVIRTLAASPTKEMLSGKFIGECGLPPSSVQFARNKLKADDLIEQGRGSRIWRVVDPVFAMWLKRL